jgi:hypothetical protein
MRVDIERHADAGPVDPPIPSDRYQLHAPDSRASGAVPGSWPSQDPQVPDVDSCSCTRRCPSTWASPRSQKQIPMRPAAALPVPSSSAAPWPFVMECRRSFSTTWSWDHRYRRERKRRKASMGLLFSSWPGRNRQNESSSHNQASPQRRTAGTPSFRPSSVTKRDKTPHCPPIFRPSPTSSMDAGAR